MRRRQFLQTTLPATALGCLTAGAPWFAACRKNLPAEPLTRSLSVFCAAGLKKPVETAAAAALVELSTQVQLQFGGSGTLLNQLRVAAVGDLFIAADAGSLADAHRLNLIRETIPLAEQTPVLAVRVGNPHQLRTLEDLLTREVKFALANPESASIGKTTRKAAGERWERLAARAAVMKPTVTEIAADLSLGALDAAILWDSTVAQFKGLEAVLLPELSAHPEQASIAVLASSSQPAAALRFARYLASPQKGAPHFEAAGMRHTPGDVWAPKPELILYSGAVNRPAIETLLRSFAAREGVEITTVFNGCGILCATMQTMGSKENPKFPDAYFACDLCFVPPVAEHFPEAVLLTETDIGIATPPGNPKSIVTLSDLARPGLRLGICNAEQSTLGFFTRGLLKATGLADAVHKNVAVEVPTADFLINQMRAGALDAVIVYRVNAESAASYGTDPLGFVPVRHEGAKAVQPFAVRKDSPNRQLSLRLLDHLKANRDSFEKVGFRWKGDAPPVQSNRINVPEWLQPK